MSFNDDSGEYRTERLDANNLTDMEKLHAGVYGKLPPRSFFSKKYDTAFTGVQHTGFIAYNHMGAPVAFYGVIPCFIRLDDKIILAAQSADTMTHPQHRNKGLFVELASQTIDLCRNVGIRVIFGFPNQNSLPGFIDKLGWRQTERMDCFIIRSGRFSWQRVLRKISFLRRFYLKYQQKQLKKYLLPKQEIDNSVFTDGYAGVYRDHLYHQYKTYTAKYIIKPGDSLAWIKIGNSLLIGDMLVAPGDFDNVINELKILARKLGLKELHFHASPGTILHALFADRFPLLPSFPVIFMDLADTPIEKIKFTAADIDTF